MRAKWPAAVILAAAVATTGSMAGEFLPNYDAWRSLSDDARAGYAVGMADDLQTPTDGDSAARRTFAAGLEVCFMRLQLKAGALVNAVEVWYRADPARRAAPAHVAFFAAVPGGLCRGFVGAGQRRPRS